MDDQEISGQETIKRHIRRRNRVIIIAVVALLVIIIVAAAFIGYAVSRRKRGKNSTVAALGIAVDGKWADWNPWSDCSQTCGGGIQVRRRTCTDPVPQNGGKTCIGPVSERRKCALWFCPDCSRVCPDGGTLHECTLCQCPNAHVTGEVTDADTVRPIFGVAVYVEHQEWIAIQITDGIGTYEIKDVCVTGLVLVFRKDGYEEKREAVISFGINSGLLDISLKRLEAPQFQTHPFDTASFIGNTVSFTCKAEAYPAPSGYDWFKDGNIIASTYNGSNVLVLSQITEKMAGRYKCRANSASGKMFSKEAELFVAGEGSDSCNETPFEQFIHLPHSCLATIDGYKVGTVDVGMCADYPCVSRALQTSETARCGPTQTESIRVECAGFSYALPRVTRCGCTECYRKGKGGTIRGEVFAVGSDPDGGSVPARAKITFNGVSILTSEQGTFTLKVSPRSSESVAIIDPVDWNQFMTQVKPLRHLEGVEVTQAVEVNQKGTAHVFNTSQDFNIQLGGDLTFASVVLPKGILVDKSGEQHDGEAKLYTLFNDPRKAGDLLRSPGDFTYVSEDGDVRHMHVYGVIGLQASDTNGRPLSPSGNVRIKLHTGTLGIFSNVKGDPDVSMWGFDPRFGNWKFISSPSYIYSRKRNADRTAEVNLEVPSPLPYILIAKPIPRRDMCHVRVVLYSSNAFTETVPGGQVFVNSKSLRDGRYMATASEITDMRGASCIHVPCGCKYEVYVRYIYAEAVPAQEQNLPEGMKYENKMTGGYHVVEFESPHVGKIDAGGPVHRTSTESCFKATGDDHYHFKFALTSRNGRPRLVAAETRPFRKLSWYQRPANSTERRACMLRVDITTTDDQMQIMAMSKFGSPDGEIYGVFTTGLQTAPGREVANPVANSKTACLLVKCPDDVYDVIENKTYPSVQTHVHIGVLPSKSVTCKFRDSVYSSLATFPQGGAVHSFSQTNHTLTLQLGDPTKLPLTPGIIFSTGISDSAYYSVRDRCLMDSVYIAHFECSNTL